MCLLPTATVIEIVNVLAQFYFGNSPDHGILKITKVLQKGHLSYFTKAPVREKYSFILQNFHLDVLFVNNTYKLLAQDRK